MGQWNGPSATKQGLNLFAAVGIGSGAVIRQTRKGIDVVKRELGLEITTGVRHVQAIVMGSACTMMKCLSRDKKMVNKWMEDIPKRVTIRIWACYCLGIVLSSVV